MRVTSETKQQTRRRIIDAARNLFTDKGFEQTTTRDIAARAHIATGTLFNYFANKEDIAMTLIADALDEGEKAFGRYREHRAQDSAQQGVTVRLDEDLFGHIVSGLRHLKPLRGSVGPVLETMMSPFSKSSSCAPAERARVTHMETVGGLLDEHGLSSTPGFVAAHLYWTLYLGVLAFWSSDESPAQADTLVLLDQALNLFAASLSNNSSPVGGRS